MLGSIEIHRATIVIQAEEIRHQNMGACQSEIRYILL